MDNEQQVNPSSKMEQYKPARRKRNIMMMIIVDILLVGVGLVVFALFHHVLPRMLDSEAIMLPTTAATLEAAEERVTADNTAADDAVAEAETVEVAVSMGFVTAWGDRFPDKFTTGEVITTDSTYISEDINASVECAQENGVTYYVTDIYVRDIGNFMTAFANATYGVGITDTTANMAAENDAVIAISGDDYGVREEGIVIRNGVLYRDELYDDVLIMNNDGSM